MGISNIYNVIIWNILQILLPNNDCTNIKWDTCIERLTIERLIRILLFENRINNDQTNPQNKHM